MEVQREMEKIEGYDESTAKTTRIYVGGLGENVTAEDLKKTFSTPQLGKIESLEIVRTKGRSFAYLDLLPSSEKSLAKLFSTYNGCMWKGGRLKIEKAKEHFFLRLEREWEEDAALVTSSVPLPVDAAEMTNSMKIQKKGANLDEMQIRVYFPKLRKLKLVPLKGTGKHKYSFQRVEVPSLPINFCDCEGHSVPFDTTTQKSRGDDSKDGGVDEKEMHIMNSVLNKILERENYSERAPRDYKFAKKVQSSKNTVDHLKIDKNLVDQEMVDGVVAGSIDRNTMLKDSDQEAMAATQVDENLLSQEMDDDDNGDGDDLIINVVARAKGRTTSFKDPSQEAMTAIQVDENLSQEMDDDDNDDGDDLIINVVASARDRTTIFKDPTQEAMAAIQNSLSKESQLATDKQRQGRKMSANRKRKVPSEDVDGNTQVLPSEPEGKESLDTLIHDTEDARPPEVKSGSRLSNHTAIFPKKSTWKDLVNASSGATFCVSDILPSADPSKELQSGSEGDKKDKKVSHQREELDKVAEAMTNNLNEPVNIARGAAWRQRSSWTQLVSNTTSSSFSISQIVPGLHLQKQELPVMQETAKVQKSSRIDKSDSKDVFKTQDKATAFGALGTSSGGALVEDEFRHVEQDNIKNELLNFSAPKQAFVDDTNFSETCSFMRSDASMKEWMKSKAALSGSLKNKAKEKK